MEIFIYEHKNRAKSDDSINYRIRIDLELVNEDHKKVIYISRQTLPGLFI